MPAELEDYIFAVRPIGREFFCYSQVGTVNSDIGNINFTYEGFNPLLPLSITSILQNTYGDYWNIYIANISDFKKENIKVNAYFYDANNRLQKVITNSIDEIRGGSYIAFSMNFGSAYSQAKTANLFLWTENMQPLSEAYIFKNELDEENVKDADVVY